MRVEMVNISDTKMSFVPDIFLEIGPPFSKGLDDRPPPPSPLSLISRSGNGFACKQKSTSDYKSPRI